MNTPTWIRHVGRSLNNNSPTVLSGVAIAGVITTAYLSAKATLKAKERLDESPDKEWTARGKVEVCWKYYVPAGISGAATIACIISSNQIGLRRQAALISAYTIAETAFREYKEKVVEEIGDIKERNIRDKVAVDQVEKNPVKDAQVIITSGGDQLCFDTLTSRYFKSDLEAIRRAENEINRRVLTDMFAAHNEFYSLLNMEPAVVGDELGWNIENLMELAFTAHLAADGTPCIAVGYVRLPRCDYHKF